MCGVDPETGANCGGCSANHFCNGAGQCARLEQTPPISVPGLDDDTRAVVVPESPPAPELFGSTPGAFNVTDRGSAMYAIAIDVPPGRAGIEPALALRYTSSTGNGALGVGWSLDGFSSISRCQRTYAQDGFTRGVKGNDEARCAWTDSDSCQSARTSIGLRSSRSRRSWPMA
jgi:hypothetical protein